MGAHRTGLRAHAICVGALMLAGCGGADVGQVVLPVVAHVPMALLARKEIDPPAGPPVAMLGYDVFVADDFLYWHECTNRETCGHVERSRRFSTLISMRRVGHASVDGRDVDVLRLEFPADP